MRTSKLTLVSSYLLLLLIMVAAGNAALRQTSSRRSVPTQLAANVSSAPPSDSYPPPGQAEFIATSIINSTPYPGPGLTFPGQSQNLLAYPGRGTERPTDTQATRNLSTATPSPRAGLTPTPANNQAQITSTPEATPTPALIRTEIQASDPKSFQVVSGRVQFVEFFAYWSPLSQSMAPVVNVLADRYKERIYFVFLDIDAPENSLYKQLIGDRLPPIFFLLDPQGGVINVWEGYVASSELENAFQSAAP